LGTINNSYNAFFVFEPNLTTYYNASGLQLIANMTDVGGVIGNLTYLPIITNMSGDSFVSGDMDYIDVDATNLTDNASINNWTVLNIREPALSGSATVTGDQTGIRIWAFTDNSDGDEREIFMEGDGGIFFRSGTNMRIASEDTSEIHITAPGTINLIAPEVYVQQDLVVSGTIYGTSPVEIGSGLNVSGGEVTLYGDATCWKSRTLYPSAEQHPSANPPGTTEYQGFQFDAFDDGPTEEQTFHIWHIPEDYAVGDYNIRGHFGLMVANPDPVVDEHVVMGFEFKVMSPGDVFDFTSNTYSGTISVTISGGETAYTWHESDVGTCLTTGANPGDVMQFRFYRDVGAAEDDYTGDALIGAYNLEYLSDKIGGHD